MINPVRIRAGLARPSVALATLLATASAASGQTSPSPAPAMASSAATASAADSPAGTADELVTRVVDAYAAESKGTVGVRTRSVLRVDAPMNHRKTTTTNWYVYDDGALVATSEAPDPRRPPIHDPLRPRYRAEYRFKSAPCGGGCPAGAVAIDYSSPTQDEVHAYGTMIVDLASAHVLHATEIPYAFAWPTHDGRLTITWGQADIGWFPTQISGDFSGRVGPFSGVAHYDQSFAPYARYASADAAVASLVAQTHQQRASDATH